MDHLIPSMQHHPYLEAYDGAVYFAIVQSINATVDKYSDKNDPRRPVFMIHTGDAVDAGVMTELYEFVYISNELDIPWYNVLGNHDSGTFGNLDPEKTYLKAPFVDFMTIHSTLDFINMHHNIETVYPFSLRAPKNTGREKTTSTDNDSMYSKFNGFDKLMYSPGEILDSDDICEVCPGYYSIEAKSGNDSTGDPAIQLIVINTGYKFLAGGKIEEEQFSWLKREIERCSDKLILVFGHHNIETIEHGDRLIDMFTENPSVVAYLCGHKHRHDINYYSRCGKSFGFWEIITDAIFAYPQQGSIVTISCREGVGLLDVYAFDHTIQETYDDEKETPQKSKLFEHARMARCGAIKDISQKRKKEIDSNDADRFARLRFPYPALE
jgi:3',5'-cyclic AMP phosphodiesterase CpdA